MLSKLSSHLRLIRGAIADVASVFSELERYAIGEDRVVDEMSSHMPHWDVWTEAVWSAKGGEKTAFHYGRINHHLCLFGITDRNLKV